MVDIHSTDSTDTFVDTENAISDDDVQRYRPINRKQSDPGDYKGVARFISNILKFLVIKLGYDPISVDEYAQQIRWPNWSILLPEIPVKFSVLII